MHTQKHIVLVLFSTCFAIIGFAQSYTDALFSTQVKTIQLYNSTNSLDSPVIALHSSQTLSLEFDILHTTIPDLQYRILLCDKLWNKSQLFQNEYIQTIGLLEFDTIEHSINTSIQYIHFSTQFPNNNIQFLVSGNYVVQVFDAHTQQVLFQKRFMVVENIVQLTTSLQRPKIVEYMNTHQAIDVGVSWESFPISNPIQDIHILIQQNNRWDNSIYLTKPTSVQINSITYNTEPYNYFYGNAEFRQFNFKNMRFASEYIERIDWENGLYKIIMQPNEIQTYKPYSNKGDLNGGFLPSHDISPYNANTVADYAQVQFSLKYFKQSYDTLDVYVVGDFNNWAISDENKMIYNNTQAQYTTTILLKQGYYDYALAFVSNDKKHIFTHEIEGSYYQTENKYEVFVYHYDISKGYDRIIAYQKVQTKK